MCIRDSIYPDQAVLRHRCIVGRPYAGGWRKRYAFLGLAPAALSAGADGTLAGVIKCGIIVANETMKGVRTFDECAKMHK